MSDKEIVKQNEALVNKFYSAFQQKDAKTMASCYHADVQFSDPAFGTLYGTDVALMWQILCAGSKDLRVEYSIKLVENNSAKVYWEAFYSYGKSARKIHNKVTSQLQIKNGLIIIHSDKFSLWRWAGQAMGFTGKLIGWTGFFRKNFQQRSRQLIERVKDRQNKNSSES